MEETLGKGSSFPCKSCGATLVYKPGENKMSCPYCGSENDFQIDPSQSEEALKELDYHEFIQKAEDETDLVEKITIKCNSCGAVFAFDENISSGNCAYCGVKIVAQKESKKVFQPKAVLPFSIDNNKARANFKTWLKKLHFAPGNLKTLASPDNLKGIYMPFWTFDSDTDTQFIGQRGEYYYTDETYETVESGKKVTKKKKVKKTKWQEVRGKIKKIFDDILVFASKSLPKRFAEKLEPWDLDKIMPFDDKFLSGFGVESYSVNLKDAFHIAKEKMDSVIRSSIYKEIGGDEQKITAYKTDFQNLKFKHILLPLWISAYRYGGKTFQFVVNARTGEVHGDRPYSKTKILFTILGVIAVIIVVIFVIKYFAN
ncbi:hypothetical protein JW890_00235 [candidate division WOR-3 bacterium]|nr:hypothetical protein [candidate division WOR-3 bacterium]